MNRVILVGRLTRDAEIRYSQDNKPIARFTLAVDRRYKREGDEQSADFISCVAFTNTASFLERYGKRGTKFVAEGRIQTGSYTNKEGQKVYTTDVVVESVEFAESKNSQGGSGADFGPSDFGPVGDDNGGFMSLPESEDELPFE